MVGGDLPPVKITCRSQGGSSGRFMKTDLDARNLESDPMLYYATLYLAKLSFCCAFLFVCKRKTIWLTEGRGV